MITTSIYIGHDNVTGIIPTRNGVPESFGSVTRVVITINGVDFDSDGDAAGNIWWNDTVTYNDLTVDVLKFKIGGQPELMAGNYNKCRVTVYDGVNVNGIVWIDDMIATVA